MDTLISVTLAGMRIKLPASEIRFWVSKSIDHLCYSQEYKKADKLIEQLNKFTASLEKR